MPPEKVGTAFVVRGVDETEWRKSDWLGPPLYDFPRMAKHPVPRVSVVRVDCCPTAWSSVEVMVERGDSMRDCRSEYSLDSHGELDGTVAFWKFLLLLFRNTVTEQCRFCWGIVVVALVQRP